MTRTKKFESISPILRALHWLPIRSRIAFKILLLTYMYQCFHEMAPSYLSELLVRYEPGRSLRSSQRDLYVIPPISTNFYGKRSFGHAAPELWNGIPNQIKRVGTIEGFKTSLKSYLFRKWCGVCYTVTFAAFYCSNCLNFLFFISPLKCIEDLAKGIMRYIRTVIIIVMMIAIRL